MELFLLMGKIKGESAAQFIRIFMNDLQRALFSCLPAGVFAPPQGWDKKKILLVR